MIFLKLEMFILWDSPEHYQTLSLNRSLPLGSSFLVRYNFSMQKTLFIAGSVFGFLSVLLGAFGAHALKQHLSSDMLAIFETGVRYQAYHAFALLAAAWAVTVFDSKLISRAGTCFTAGIIIFSGSLYTLAISGIKVFGAITPIGGLLLMAGWVFMILGSYKGK